MKKRNIFREKLLKWKIIEENKVAPIPDELRNPPGPFTKLVDGEPLVQVASSKGKIIEAIILEI